MNILCLESLWDSGDALSVVPILEVLKSNYSIFYDVIRFFNREEFFSSLTHIDKYDIIYIATHGDPGVIKSGDGKTTVSFEEISASLSGRLENKSIHIASCATLNVEENILTAFIRSTGCKTLSGYNLYTYWVESASTDLSLLEWLITTDLRKSKNLKLFTKRYESLIEASGLVLRVNT